MMDLAQREMLTQRGYAICGIDDESVKRAPEATGVYIVFSDQAETRPIAVRLAVDRGLRRDIIAYLARKDVRLFSPALVAYWEIERREREADPEFDARVVAEQKAAAEWFGLDACCNHVPGAGCAR